jgi:hypothetical protein
LQESIAEMDKRLASLANTEAYLGKFSALNLNGLSLAAIPAGQDERKQYPTAANISEMCVKNKTTGAANPMVAIGTAANDTISVFNGLPSIALKKIIETRDNNKKMKTMLEGITMTKGQAVKGSNLTLFASQKTIDFVNSQFDLMGGAIALSVVNQKIAADYFIPVTPDDLAQNYPSVYADKQ